MDGNSLSPGLLPNLTHWKYMWFCPAPNFCPSLFRSSEPKRIWELFFHQTHTKQGIKICINFPYHDSFVVSGYLAWNSRFYPGRCTTCTRLIDSCLFIGLRKPLNLNLIIVSKAFHREGDTAKESIFILNRADDHAWQNRFQASFLLKMGNTTGESD